MRVFSLVILWVGVITTLNAQPAGPQWCKSIHAIPCKKGEIHTSQYTPVYYGNSLFLLSKNYTAPLLNPAWVCGLPFSDTRDGQVYTTVLIGTQCWMAENLNIGIFISGSCEQYDNGIIEKYCYGNNEANCDEYGGLYSWDEVMQYSRATGAQGICPDGWHVPTDEEWCILEQHVDTSISCALFGWRGETGGGALKETGLVHWLLPNTNASNTDGFNALPGGGRGCSGRFTGLRSNGRWWTSNCFTWVYACDRGLSYCNSKVRRDSTNKKDGFSVRCLKD